MGKTLSKRKSNCTAYIWLPDGSRAGHAALRLKDGTYISWWPEDKKGLRPQVRGTNKKRKNDIQVEGEPDYTFVFPAAFKLNQTAMKKWFQAFRNEDGTWCPQKNCCWVVRRTLIAGGIERHVYIDEAMIENPIHLEKVLSKIPDIDIRIGKSANDTEKIVMQKLYEAKMIILCGVIAGTLGILRLRK